MPCNCGGAKSGTVYLVRFSDGSTKTYLSQYEATLAASKDPHGATITSQPA